MKWSAITAAGASTLLMAWTAWSQAGFPRMTKCDPGFAVAGEVVSITGENLGKANVAELYLTDGRNDIKVPIAEQTGTMIKFKVPANVKPRRLSLMVLTGGADPKLIEQPLKITIETEESRKERLAQAEQRAKEAAPPAEEPKPAEEAKPPEAAKPNPNTGS